MSVACVNCGGEVTSNDPTAYPYCKTCHYTGAAAERMNAERLAELERLLPGASLTIEHTGGGCFWAVARWPGEPRYYAITDGNAGIPEPEEGWGFVGRFHESDEHADFEGTELGGVDPEDGAADDGGLSNGQVADLILQDHDPTFAPFKAGYERGFDQGWSLGWRSGWHTGHEHALGHPEGEA